MCRLSPIPIRYENLKRNKNSGFVGGKPSLVGFLKIMSTFLSYKSYFVRNNWRQSPRLDPKEHATQQWIIIKTNIHSSSCHCSLNIVVIKLAYCCCCAISEFV